MGASDNTLEVRLCEWGLSLPHSVLLGCTQSISLLVPCGHWNWGWQAMNGVALVTRLGMAACVEKGDDRKN
jgi:hypothetical protein